MPGEPGDDFYVLVHGKVEFSVQGKTVGVLVDGYFGDLALMSNSLRAATAIAVRDCRMWTLSRQFFRSAMMTSSSNQSDKLVRFLSKIQLFHELDAQSLLSLARSVTKKTYEDNELIVRQV